MAYTDQQLEAALRRADAAGNAEDARALAQELQKRRLSTETEGDKKPTVARPTQRQAAEDLSSGAWRETEKRQKAVTSPRYGGGFMTGQGIDDQKEIRAKEIPALKKSLSGTLQVPEVDVDVTTGMPFGDRLQAGKMKSFEDKFNYYDGKYGNEGDVRVVYSEGQPQIVVSHPTATQGKYFLADEYGASLSDVADARREVQQTGAEIGSSLLFTYMTGGMGAAYPLLRAAAGAGLGRMINDLAMDLSYDKANQTEADVRKIIGDSFKSGATTFALDLGFGSALKSTGKAFVNLKSPTGRDSFAKKLDDAQKRIEERLNKKFPDTMASRAGTEEAFLQQAKVTASVPENSFFGFMARRTARARDVLRDMKQSLLGGKPVPYEQSYKEFVTQVKDEYDTVIRQLDETDAVLAKQLAEIRDSRIAALDLSSLGSAPADLSGDKIRKAITASENIAKETSRALYRDVFDQANEVGLEYSAKEVGNRVLKTINSLNLPKDINDEVLRTFVPSKLNRARRQASQLRDTIDVPTGGPLYGARGELLVPPTTTEGAVQNLSLEQLDEYRKSIRQIITREASKEKPDGGLIKKLVKVENEVSSIMDDGIEAFGGESLIRANKNAKEFFIENVLPFRSKGVGASLKTDGVGNFLEGNASLSKKYFSGGRAMENIKELKRAIGNNNPEGLEALRKGYVDYLYAKTLRSDGTINYDKLKNITYDKEIATAILGETQARAIRELDEAMVRIGVDTIDPVDFEKVINAKTPQDIKDILPIIEQKAFQKRYQEKVLGPKLIKKIIDGELDVSSPEAFMVAFRNLNATQAKKVLQRVKTPEAKSSFRRKVIQDLFEQASEGGSALQKTSKKFGRENLWDPRRLEKLLANKKYREMLNSVLGKNTVRDIEDMNTIMIGNMQSKTGMSSLVTGDVARGQEGKPLLRVPIDAVWYRLFSVASESQVLGNLLRDNKSNDEIFSKLIPTLLASRRGLDALMYEATEDPKLESWLSQFVNE